MRTPAPASHPARGRGLFIAVLVFCLLGLAASAELTLVHVRVYQDPEVQSFCAFNEGVNCDTVALSDYSIFLGVPVSVWGMLGYVVMALVALWGWRGSTRLAARGALLALTAFSALLSAVLGTISVLKISSVCVVCVATYVDNFILLALSVILVRQEGLVASLRAVLDTLGREWRRAAGIAATGAVAVALLMAFYPAYWLVSAHATGGLDPPPIGSSTTQDRLRTGVTEQGHHWVGAVRPELVIEEFSDYQCPFCLNAHLLVRALVQTNPDRLRLIHRHYPLDHHCNPIVNGPFHPNSCVYAALAACAGEQGKFWEANDYLYQHGHDDEPVKLGDLVAATGVSDSGMRTCLEQRAPRLIEKDLKQGIKLGLRGTPSFKIGDKVYTGELPQDQLKPYFDKLEQQLEREMKGSSTGRSPISR